MLDIWTNKWDAIMTNDWNELINVYFNINNKCTVNIYKYNNKYIIIIAMLSIYKCNNISKL